MRNKFFLILLFCSLLTSSFAQKSKKFTSKTRFTITKKNTSDIVLTCILPSDIKNVQKILSIDFSLKPTRIFNANGNRYAQFVFDEYPTDLFDNPKKSFSFLITTHIRIYKNDLGTALSCKSAPIDTVKNFLNHEIGIESENENLIELANSLKGKNQLETLDKIYFYVKQNIRYRYNGIDYGALFAYNLKNGDCSEISDLFVALCRANGIPARSVYGNVAKGSGHIGHAWTEVFVKNLGWITFDPTIVGYKSYKRNSFDYIQLAIKRADNILNGGYYFSFTYDGEIPEVKYWYKNR